MLSLLICIIALFVVANSANIEEVSINQLHEPEAECVFSVHNKNPNGEEVSG